MIVESYVRAYGLPPVKSAGDGENTMLVVVVVVARSARGQLTNATFLIKCLACTFVMLLQPCKFFMFFIYFTITRKMMWFLNMIS